VYTQGRWGFFKIMKNIKTFFKDIIASFNNKDGGASARKLTAFWAIVLMGGYITIRLLPSDSMLHALYSWQLLGLLCLGIITAEQIIKFKTGTNNKNENEKENN
jgi:hypothetical protein